MKIVINTNTHYRQPLTYLLRSILAANFNRYEDIIVVISESVADTTPAMEPLRNIADIDSDEQVVVIRLCINNFDYAGFNALHLFKNHPLIYSERYFYLLDSSSVEFDFYDKIMRFNNIQTNQLVVNGPLACSNVIIFGNRVIDIYGDKYNRNLTKDQATSIEISPNPIIIDGVEYRNFWGFDNVIRLPDRVQQEDVDIYNTGHKRITFYYPDYGVKKYIFWAHDGDIKNNIKPINLIF